MLFLANLIDRPVLGVAGESIGALDDLIVRMGGGEYPPLSGLVVRDGRRRFFIPVSHLAQLDGAAQLSSSIVDLQPFRRRDGEVLLGKDVLDHQIIDIEGRRIVRVNDVQLALVEGIYRVVGVDVSPQALLRRLGPRALAGRVVGRQVIDWAEVQYLASAAPVRLRVSYDRLAALHPVDLARIVDALSYHESAEIVAALDDETAANALEEVSDERLADLLEGMDRERAADILEEMTPGAAADILEDMDAEVADELLARMDPEEAADVQVLLAYQEDRVGRIMTTDFISAAESATVGETIAAIRALEDAPDPLLAVYVVSPTDPDAEEQAEEVDAAPEAPPDAGVPDEGDTAGPDVAAQLVYLHGIVRLRSLILADPGTTLAELMETEAPSVHPDDPAEEAARVLAEYNLLAVPVVDDARHLIGIVTVDEALAVLLPEIWQRRGARAFG
jgi:CBS domain-containing protein